MKSKTWIMLLLGLLILCAGLSVWLMMPGEPAQWAQIRSRGALVKTVDLRIDQTFVIEDGNSRNTVTVRDGKIAVTDATCPDHYCMERGFCDGGAAIVCLPNQLVITFVGQLEVDGVAG